MRNTYLSNLAEKIKIVFQMKLQQALQMQEKLAEHFISRKKL